MNYFDIIEKLIIPITLILMGYWLGNRGKRVDVDIQKTRELNIVLSNMLNSWYYLNKLSDLLKLQEEKGENLLFPKYYAPFLVLKSGVLNDNCFEELEDSIETLKQYDPISYYELVGVGKKFDFIKTNYVLPFLKTGQNENLETNKISRNFLDKLLNDIETYLRQTAIQISKDTLKKINRKIEIAFENDLEDLKEAFNIEYYEVVISIMPENKIKPSYEEFKNEMGQSEIQGQLKKEIDFIIATGMEEFISLMTKNPTLSIDELREKIINSIE